MDSEKESTQQSSAQDMSEEEFKSRIDAVDQGFVEEQRRFEELGIEHPSTGYRPDLFQMVHVIDALNEILVEKGIIGERDLFVRSRERMLKEMVSAREELEPQILEMRRQALIHRTMPPGFPNGQPPFER